MLDDLRNSASKSFQDDEEEETTASPKAREVIRLRPARVRDPRAPRGQFLGMTPEQRFVVALLLFLMVMVMGALLLLATQKVFPF